mgnify:FL=1
MDTPFESSEDVRTLIYDLLGLLAQHGITRVSLGGVMRMLGVPNEKAKEHDEEYFHVTLDAVTDLRDSDEEIDEEIPPGTTLH